MKKTCTLIVVTMLAFCGCSNHSAPTPAENLHSKSSAATVTVEAGKFLPLGVARHGVAQRRALVDLGLDVGEDALEPGPLDLPVSASNLRGER